MCTKICFFNNTPNDKDWAMVYAMAETGEVLASHACSHIGYMFHDLYGRYPEREAEWNTKFPNGFEIVLMENGQVAPSEVYAKNQKLKQLAQAITT
jgi:hypothetical protein